MPNKQKSSQEAASTDLVGHTKNSLSAEQIELIKSTVAKGASDDELKLFLYTATRTGLDPLTRQIYFQKRSQRQKDGSYKDVMTILTGIDGYRAIADRTGQLAGIEDPIYEEEVVITSSGANTSSAAGKRPIKATATVFKMVDKNRVPFTASARWSEYAPQDPKMGFMWNKMPYLMLGKVAEALALRKAFPLNLSGLYTTEEMEQAGPIKAEEDKPTEVSSPKPVLNPLMDYSAKELVERKIIFELCERLDITHQEMIMKIDDLTQLDAKNRSNYPEIINRLQIIVEQKNVYE